MGVRKLQVWWYLLAFWTNDMGRKVLLPVIGIRPSGGGNSSHFSGILAGQEAITLAPCEFLVCNRKVVFASTETHKQRRIQIGERRVRTRDF